MDQLIGSRLREARKNAGMFQADAAEKMEMSRPTLSAIESGKRTVTAEEIIRFAELYHVTSEYLLYGMEESNPQVQRLMSYSRMFAELTTDEQKQIVSMMKNMKDQRSSDD
ncbi:helix-turn-helix domain-containing protein [Clostridium vitabionis]|uniref:helix-turn-helix domain-containing protein n=1 Tax=Clostridium vitabionis TaxID=2784388 RepID=UPI00188CB990|nr:helix-turn-helix transcriptional regulator [Clostridium vitabionis]